MKEASKILAFLCLLSVQAFGQLSFKNATLRVPNSTTRMTAVEVADVSNDGLNDVVAGPISLPGSSSKLYLALFLQTENGNLTTPTTLMYSQTGELLSDIELADINNDKLNDIVCSFGSSIGIFYQLPSGGFGGLKKLTGIQSSCGVKTADLNNDGLLDVLGFQGNAFKLFLQTSTGEFNTTSIAAKTSYSTLIQVGDLNGDGLTDIANTYGGNVAIMYQKPITGFAQPDTSSLLNSSSEISYISGFNASDINKDGRTDLVIAYGGNSGRMKVYYQTAEGKMDATNAKSYRTYDIPTPIQVADLNCDGEMEIILGHSGWGNLSIFDKQNLVNLAGYTLYPSNYYYTPFSMAVGDINNDQRIDLLDVDMDATLSILYNQTKPKTFDNYEHLAENVYFSMDTTVLDTVQYTIIPDPATDCKRNNYTKYQLHQVWENQHIHGDSLLIRHAWLCAAYTDTIRTAFHLTKFRLLKSDTIVTSVNLDVLKATVQTVHFDAEQGEGEIHLASNVCWTIEVNQDWVKPLLRSGKNSGTGVVEDLYIPFQVNSNSTVQEREATLTISGMNGSPTYSYTIHQVGAKPEVLMTASSLVLNETVNNAAHLLLWSSVNWKIDFDANWLTLDKTQGSSTIGNYDVLTLQALPNDSESDRTAVLTLSGDSNIVKQVVVRQLKIGYSRWNGPLKKNIQVYPNPVDDVLMVELPESQTGTFLQLSDLRGIVLYETKSIVGNQSIDFSHYQKGMYLLRMKIGDQIVLRKILKN